MNKNPSTILVNTYQCTMYDLAETILFKSHNQGYYKIVLKS